MPDVATGRSDEAASWGGRPSPRWSRPRPLKARAQGPKRAGTLDDVQRHAPEQAYFVYTPTARNASSWAPCVKSHGPKKSLDSGAQLEGIRIDRA